MVSLEGQERRLHLLYIQADRQRRNEKLVAESPLNMHLQGRVTRLEDRHPKAPKGSELLGTLQPYSWIYATLTRVSSNRAREERALAIERRLQALSGGSTSNVKDELPDESEEEYETTAETDAERRDALLISKQDEDEIEYLGSGKSWRTFEDDFSFVGASQSGLDPPGRSSTPPSTSSTGAGKSQSISKGLGNMVKAEVDLRKKEALGLAPVKGKGRTLGIKPLQPPPMPPAPVNGWCCSACTL
jgi:DNA-dependent metalloprotease WSS1